MIDDNKNIEEIVDCKCPDFRAQMFRGVFGLEKETLRVDENGELSQTPHPFTKEEFGRDFAECQLEMVTPVCQSTRELHETLASMQREAEELLAGLNPPEKLWPCSNPCRVHGDIPVADFEGVLEWKSEYRRHLAKVYGKEKMLFSGIHYNFSFPENLIPEKCRDRVYLNLARHLYEYAYIPVMLMAASPVYDETFCIDGEVINEQKNCVVKSGLTAAEIKLPTRDNTIISQEASIRCGEHGYWNNKELILDFTSVQAYVNSVHRHIEEGTVQMASELYLPVRLKSAGDHSVEGLTESGICYVEYRMVDLNPLHPVGIDYRDLEFLHLLMIYLTFLPEEEFTEARQRQAIRNVKRGAKLELPEDLVEEALKVIDNMREFYAFEDILVEEYFAFQEDKLRDKKKRYAYQMIEKYGNNYVERMMEEL